MNGEKYSVSDAIKIEKGTIRVSGMINSVSAPYKIISKSKWTCENPKCNLYGGQSYYPYLLLPPSSLDNTTGAKIRCFKCNSDLFKVTHEYKNARTIQIEDTDKTENNDRLEVLLYDEASSNVVAGETVDITGDISIQRRIDGGKGRKLITTLHSNNIKYKNKEEVIVTTKDIEIFYRWKKICDISYKNEVEAANRKEKWSKKIKPLNFVERITGMFAPNVIGHDDAKLAILLSLVGGRDDHGNDNGRRGRINTLLVGDPGTAKSLLARESTKIFPRSRYVTAQNASGKSLIAIVDKENDSPTLRLGAAVLAKGSICAINEITALGYEDQSHLLDIAEEGRCTVDKYGTHFDIDAPTTIIATANPFRSTWSSATYIDKDEIPSLKTLLDRFDQINIFRDTNDEGILKEFANIKTKLRNRRGHNYNFLKKYITYAKSLKPKYSDETELRLNQFWIKSKLAQLVTNRGYDSLFRIGEAQAKLNLCSAVDDSIVEQVMESQRVMLSHYGRMVEIVKNPKEISYIAFQNILKECRSAMSVKDLCRIACEENEQIRAYIGEEWSLDKNIRLKSVIEMLKNTDRINIDKLRPLEFSYRGNAESDLSDTSDTSDASSKAEQVHSV